MQFLTDTHALIWHFTDSPRITRKAREVFERCERGGCVVFIPTIVVAECPSLFEKKRVSFDFKGAPRADQGQRQLCHRSVRLQGAHSDG